ncbi:hypothetical protein GE061_010870 [Apolygus lucorum]|uniref:EGF-like domain-containing protein n=1 Tax=Apolygus lucorum TaxID=248454 RepID=A0A8S9XZY3_APOLU|nr:hypothetical protein GE061_010870 [Apolygus lucorum]
MKILLLFAVGISILCIADAQHADCRKIGKSSYNAITSVTCDDDDCPNSGMKEVLITKCCDGYKRNGDDVCEPECNPRCIRGTCVISEKFGNGKPKCQCERGYQFQKGSDYHCVPVCPQGCGKYSTCTMPGRCECHSGYEENRETNTCEPICDPECIKGTCSSPGKCTCVEGYALKRGTNHDCEPRCEQKCINGTCSAPDTCQCNAGYTPQDGENSICVPHCPGGCRNGDCNEPFLCECHDGYEKYEIRASVCHPICENGCLRGTCVGPNLCKCGPRYVLRDETVPYTCVPDCGEGCVNSECIAPDVCSCHEGFYKDNEEDKICHPHCTSGCPHGQCVDQQTCDCQQGYVQSQDKSTCLPYCSKECLYGSCIGEDRCVCNIGFTQSVDLWNVCVPKCSSCDNGECTAPDECTCNDDYIYDYNSKKCEPLCKKECIRGFCKEPNVCGCDAGTVKSGPFHCTPTCKTHSDDKNCYFAYSSPIAQSDYSLNVKDSSLMLSTNHPVVHHLPCVHHTDTPHSTVVNYTCFTHPRHGEVSAEIVCSISSDTTQIPSVFETVRPVQEISTVHLIILHRNTSELCPARICSTSNRKFHINRLSHLSMCFEEKIVEAGVPVHNFALYSILALVLISAVVAVSAKCFLSGKLSSKNNANNISRDLLIEEEPEEAEQGVPSALYSDISDRRRVWNFIDFYISS